MSGERPARRGTPAACSIPPQVYDIAFGWDPQPEISRLLLLSGEGGVSPRRVLELACGTGRLLRALPESVTTRVGLDLSPAMVEYAQQRGGGRFLVGDMADFELDTTFDLIFTSANSLRHLTEPNQLGGLWRCVAEHLCPGGVFVADLELGIAEEAERAGTPSQWMNSRDGTLVHTEWLVERAPSADSPRSHIRWRFESRYGQPSGCWEQTFTLRAFEAAELVAEATAAGTLALLGLYELRDPYLLPVPAERASGRLLVALKRVGGPPAD